MNTNDVINELTKFAEITARQEWYAQNKNEVITLLADISERNRQECEVAIENITELFKGKGKTAKAKELKTSVKMEGEKRIKERNKDSFDEYPNLIRNEKGKVMPTQENLVKVILACKHLPLVYDAYSNQQVYQTFGQQDLPWQHNGMDWFDLKLLVNHTEKDTNVIRYHQANSRYQLAALKMYLNKFFTDEINFIALKDALITASHGNTVNIYQEYIDYGLPEWDNKDRMDFLHRFAGVKHQQWSRVIGKLIFLGMIARCYDPGFDYRGIVVLEGPQNSGKSRLCRLLAFHPHFFHQLFFTKNESTYEVTRQISGMAVIELAEMGNIRGRDNNYIKAFFSMLRDTNRPMHSDTVERLKRVGIFIITTNELGRYLADQTGNSRFAPCHCDTALIDIDGIEAELPQLFAQAKYMWRHGETPRLTPEEEILQKEMLEPREIRSDYYYRILEVLKLHRDQIVHEWDDGFTMDEMLEWISNDPSFNGGPKQKQREEISKALRKHFHIENTVKWIPAEKRLGTDPSTSRKWRYQGKVAWDTFIDTIED